MQRGIELEERDIFRQPLTEAEIGRILDRVPLQLLVSAKSPQYRALQVKPDGLSRDEAISLLAREPRLLRRPIVEVGDRLIVGFDRQAFEDLVAYLSDRAP